MVSDNDKTRGVYNSMSNMVEITPLKIFDGKGLFEVKQGYCKELKPININLDQVCSVRKVKRAYCTNIQEINYTESFLWIFSEKKCKFTWDEVEIECYLIILSSGEKYLVKEWDYE